MEYTLTNTINKPFEEVTAKHREPDGALQWMEGLQKIEHMEGTPGELGAKSNFHFVHKGKEMTITETIVEQNMPKQIKFAYQSSMGHNTVEMQFEKIDDHTTLQRSINYFELKGGMKLMGFLFKGMFKKQTMKYMDGFKKYCEQ